MGLRMDIFSSAWTSSISPFSAQLSAQTKKDGRTRWSMMVLVPHTDSKPFSLLSPLSVFPPIMILWRVRIISQVSNEKRRGWHKSSFLLLHFFLTFLLLRGSKTKDFSKGQRPFSSLVYCLKISIWCFTQVWLWDLLKSLSNVCFRITWYEFEALKDSSNNFWKAEVEKFEPQVENGRGLRSWQCSMFCWNLRCGGLRIY